MNKLLKKYEKIIESISIVEDSEMYNICDINEQFIVLEGLDKETQIEVRFLIYDCSGSNQFSYDDYYHILESEKGIFSTAMIFDDLDQESKTRFEEYKKLDAVQKKEFNIWFDEKISIYMNCGDSIEIEVGDNGINYLEYMPENKDNLRGYIYNVSYCELKKILNITGSRLFKKNVRVGLGNNRTGKNIKMAFEEYIKVGLYKSMRERLDNEELCNEALELLELGDEIIEQSSPDKFWFYHNGVTIFSYGEEVFRRNNKIKLEPQNISIINGAQTLSNFYNAINEMKYNFTSLMQKFSSKDFFNDKWIENQLDEICRKIIIKTIIIDGTDFFVNKISEGLNTQIPIEEEDILAVSEEVMTINKILKKNKISIMRDGDVNSDDNLSVIEYIKKYLMIINKPGTSKNLSRKSFKGLLKDSINECKKEGFAQKLSVLIELDNWWKISLKKNSVFYSSNQEKFYRYGKNYFGSYVLLHDIVLVDDENFYNLFIQFVEDFSALRFHKEIELEDFKKDELFDSYLEKMIPERKKATSNKLLEKIDKGELCEYLNNNVDSKYTVSKVISEYLLKKEKSLEYFRVIAISNKKINEAYPFPVRTFTQLYQDIKDEKSVTTEYAYENSEFAKEIARKFPIFVVFWNEERKDKKIEKVEVVENFTFKNYETDAKIVFQRTKEAFEQGDENSFPKSSEGLHFHVRPKALNGEDTFEFSNGKQITKRTFWANKSTIEEILRIAGKI